VARIFIFLFLALALTLTVAYGDRFFSTPGYEEGDDAANALQIHRAKQLRELHGNYSQWGFRHPGPAFFYAYAAGERLLVDLTRLAPAPRNAHLYTSALLQLAFYAAAVALLARRTRQPVLTIGVALALAALHYPQVERAIYSTWPPDVLLMPFLCLVVACAAVHAGDRVALPILVLAGGFLVHGHAAQILFVGPMSLVAVHGAWRHSPDGGRGLLRSGPGVAAAVLLGVFLLPLGLDALAGRASNAHDILLHLRYQGDAGQTLRQALLCYGSYFLGLNDPSAFNVLTPSSFTPFLPRAWLLAAWAGLFAATAWWFFVRERRGKPADAARLGRRLLGFWLLGGALTIVWGMKQDGGFTSYNSHFNHSLVHVLALAAALVLMRAMPRVPRPIALGAGVAGVFAFAVALPMTPGTGRLGDAVAGNLPALLAADPRPAAPKLLRFSGDDWYEATTLARALQRLGIEVYVHPLWRVMFGADLTFRNQGGVLHRGGVSVWQIVPREEAPAAARPLGADHRVVFPELPVLECLPFHLDFTSGAEQERPVLFGIGPTEEEWAWTDAPVAALEFGSPPATRPLELTIDASGHTTPRTPAGQRVVVFVNGERIGRHVFSDTRERLTLRIPAGVWNGESPRRIVLELPDAIAPAAVGNSPERRLLGLRLYGISVGLETADGDGER
jgi:hypothetical protein